MSETTAMRPPKSAFGIINALNAEWEHLVTETAPLGPQWTGLHPALSGCVCLDDLLDAVRAAPDAILWLLLDATAHGDELAGRVVMQAMLGKLVRMASVDRAAGADEYVAAMWCRIRTYPLQTRPRKIAANLALDVLKTVNQEKHWGRRAPEVALVSSAELMDLLHTQSVTRAQLDHGADVALLSATTVIHVADQLGLIDQETRDVLLSVYAEGLSSRAAAVRHRTNAAMIRFRCSKAVRRLTQHSVTLTEAA